MARGSYRPGGLMKRSVEVAVAGRKVFAESGRMVQKFKKGVKVKAKAKLLAKPGRPQQQRLQRVRGVVSNLKLN